MCTHTSTHKHTAFNVGCPVESNLCPVWIIAVIDWSFNANWSNLKSINSSSCCSHNWPMTYKQAQTAHRQTERRTDRHQLLPLSFSFRLSSFLLLFIPSFFLSFLPFLLLYHSSSLFPSSVPLLFINLNLSVCAPWSKMSTQSKYALAHRAMCHIISPTRSQRHRQAHEENQITFVCPVTFSSESLCAYMCVQGFVFRATCVCTHVSM